jgi:hypothetical protein
MARRLAAPSHKAHKTGGSAAALILPAIWNIFPIWA